MTVLNLRASELRKENSINAALSFRAAMAILKKKKKFSIISDEISTQEEQTKIISGEFREFFLLLKHLH